MAEEIDRLGSHVTEVSESCRRSRPVGRRVDFRDPGAESAKRTRSRRSQEEAASRRGVELRSWIEQSASRCRISSERLQPNPVVTARRRAVGVCGSSRRLRRRQTSLVRALLDRGPAPQVLDLVHDATEAQPEVDGRDTFSCRARVPAMVDREAFPRARARFDKLGTARGSEHVGSLLAAVIQ